MSLANELRMRNWVYALKETPEPITIGFEYNIYFDRDYSPVPLSEEWLLKFGFELYDYLPNDEMSDNPDFIYLSYKMELEGKRYYYTMTNTEFDDWQFCIKVEWAEEMLIASCQYVHQLQNLYFALTGTELQFQNDQPNL
jgi:hypothetical protein